jgi:hypothetical protein
MLFFSWACITVHGITSALLLYVSNLTFCSNLSIVMLSAVMYDLLPAHHEEEAIHFIPEKTEPYKWKVSPWGYTEVNYRDGLNWGPGSFIFFFFLVQWNAFQLKWRLAFLAPSGILYLSLRLRKTARNLAKMKRKKKKAESKVSLPI